MGFILPVKVTITIYTILNVTCEMTLTVGHKDLSYLLSSWSVSLKEVNTVLNVADEEGV